MTESDPNRPDPEALLSEVAQNGRGGLKIFLGASPGVGKTFKMLQAAQEARSEGVDLVIGLIESHGRAETEAIAEGLELIPRQRIPYRGRIFEELDLDAILQRAPAVVLIDELAHRNIPGTRHPRRYQDIEELLGRGIDVWTAVNIQHLESLNDAVARITGVRMRETVPDALIAKARDLVLVDLTPSELIDRLKQGKVYVPEQARAALDGFFSPSNLAALRELALQTVAERIDLDVRAAMRRRGVEGPWPVRTRILVAVDGVGNNEEVVRLGRRLAERRRAPWSVVYVEARDSDPERRARVERVFHLAERLGAEVVTLRGQDPVEEILSYARARNVTTLVMGRSRHRRLAGLLGRTLSQRLLREGGEFEITFVPSSIARARRREPGRRRLDAAGDYLVAAGVIAASGAIAALLEPLLPLANLSLVFLAGVLWVAVRSTLGPALVTALVSAALYNFLFTEPRYTFLMHRTDELLTIVFFLLMGLAGGQLASRLRRQMIALRATNAQTQTLLDLGRRLTAAADLPSVRLETVRSLAEYLRVRTVLLAPTDDSGALREAIGSDTHSSATAALDDKVRAAAQWAYDHRQPSGAQTETLSGLTWRFLPLAIEKETFGVIGLDFAGTPPVSSAQLAALDVLVSQAALAMARTRLADRLEQAKVAEETERLRSALLSSVSHDLRTPLASMIGAASSLRALDGKISPADRAELLDAVLSEGERLNRYIQNLLDMTRLGHGTLRIERDWIGIDDLINAALRRLREPLQGLRVTRAIAPDLPLLYVHPALVEQALVNVIENAARFSPPGGEIRLTATRAGESLRLTISDQGPGIPEEDRRRVFDMFFTGSKGDRSKQGSGLGLAICSGMIGAHGGRIEALEGPGGRGATIAIALPIIEMPPSTGAEGADTDGETGGE
ncbi:sensor histidine kinase [Thiocapsa roseopersicina]|uniref:histidine kinase n=1 Tax=Thiocapsa roseopersicina TaxID=1058 RepID=A0A1H2VH82_THIRO|nr:sensor histidine kinase KdpD [Thiocapsa roseopersicina]SDW67681.1 two-component system, OmpR family, sensor histidine kinase KdpD [Thiocapsa roseopersicina]